MLGFLPGKKKYDAATNALLVEHALGSIEFIPENPFAQQLKAAIVQVQRYALHRNVPEQKVYSDFNSYTRFQQLNIIAMAFNEVGIEPVLHGEYWQPVKNPFLPNLDSPSHIRAVAERLARKHGTRIEIGTEPMNIETW